MKVTHLGHSTVLVEAVETRLLIDPGNFSQAWHEITDLDAIVVTHAHPDHIDPDWIGALLDHNPDSRWLVEPGVPDVVPLPDRVERFAAGSHTDVGSIRVEAVGGRHAVIHRDIPRIGNIGVVISEAGGLRFFHTGDEIDTVPFDIDLLAVPAHAPWCAMKEIIDFVREVGAGRGFLIHEGLVNERGWRTAFTRLNEMTGTAFTDARNGIALTL
jgi:L-ascorbate metabolism protein UlaG (beta-lactamase superfamily)